VNLPGSTGGVKDGLAVLAQLLVHAVDQIHGGDHPAPSSAHAPSSAQADTAAGADTSVPRRPS
jgi:hypothetical protein